MEKQTTPFYDPLKTYQQNYAEGPFGAFAEATTTPQQNQPLKYTLLGQKLNLPFGIPAGPLLNGKFVTAALNHGFDIATYKTVRTREYPVNGFPNVVPLKVNRNLTLDIAQKGIVATKSYKQPLTITNSFGVPSFSPDTWQPDMANAIRHTQKGQLIIGSFQGTTGSTPQVYIKDFATAAKLVKETGAKILEANLSCPNEGSSHLLCFDIPTAKTIIEAIKHEIGDTPLIIKIAYFEDPNQLKKLIMEIGNLVQAIASINTIPAKIYADQKHTKPALDKNRLISGTCGSGIKWAGLLSTQRLKTLREELNLNYTIIGVGGVTTPQDYTEYLNAGADAVLSATGAMWNPLLAQEIKNHNS